MEDYKYCNAGPAPVTSITTPTDLTLPLSPPPDPSVMEVFQSANGRAAPIPGLPVLIVHRHFLRSGVAEELATTHLRKAVQIEIAQEVSACLQSRSQHSPACASWLNRFSVPGHDLATSALFGFVHRFFSPRPLKTRAPCQLDRPFLLICLSAPPSGTLIRCPGYPDSAIRLFAGDAILCPSLSDETDLVSHRVGKQDVGHYMRLYGDPVSYEGLFATRSKSSASSYTSPPAELDHLDHAESCPDSSYDREPGSLSEEATRREAQREQREPEIRSEAEMDVEAALPGPSIIGEYEARIAALEANLAVERAKAAYNTAVQLQREQERRVEETRVALIQAEEGAKHAERAERQSRAAAAARDEAESARITAEKSVAGDRAAVKDKRGSGDEEKRQSARPSSDMGKAKEDPLGEDGFIIIDRPWPLVPRPFVDLTNDPESSSKRRAEDSPDDSTIAGKRRKT